MTNNAEKTMRDIHFEWKISFVECTLTLTIFLYLCRERERDRQTETVKLERPMMLAENKCLFVFFGSEIGPKTEIVN